MDRSDWYSVIRIKEIILLGDFKIDLKKSKPPIVKITSTYIIYTNWVTHNSKTLVDHIYVSEIINVIETCVPVSNISDHFPACLTWTKRVLKQD